MYRMTPARKAALKKAQLASARKRKSRGKAPVRKNRVRAVAAASKGVRRRGAAPKSSSSKASVKSRNRKIAKRTAIAVGAIGAAAGAGYVYKNRERLIIAPGAEAAAVYFKSRAAKRAGRPLTKEQKHQVRMQERSDHASRSTFRAREYLVLRKFAKSSVARGRSLRPGSASSVWEGHGIPISDQFREFQRYRRDVHSRAENRLARMKGKTRRFGYQSGKIKKVSAKGKVTRLWI